LSERKHPADEIGKELLRAGGILSSLSNCYDRQIGVFDVGHGFLFEALGNVERMLRKAEEALDVLCENYDLRSINEIKKEALDAAVALASSLDLSAISATETNSGDLSAGSTTGLKGDLHGLSDDDSLDEQPLEVEDPFGGAAQFIDYLQTSESAARLSHRLDAILERFPREEPPKTVAQPVDTVSKTYAEFLDKLTAMADAAAGEAARAGKKELSLAPVLDSLRADVMRLRAVA
jgi:hypothetical protein